MSSLSVIMLKYVDIKTVMYFGRKFVADSVGEKDIHVYTVHSNTYCIF